MDDRGRARKAEPPARARARSAPAWAQPHLGPSALSLWRDGPLRLPPNDEDCDRAALQLAWTRFDCRPTVPWRKATPASVFSRVPAMADGDPPPVRRAQRAAGSSSSLEREGAAFDAIMGVGAAAAAPAAPRQQEPASSSTRPPFHRHVLPTRMLFSSYAAGRPMTDAEKLRTTRHIQPDRVLYQPQRDGKAKWRKPDAHEAGQAVRELFSTYATEEVWLQQQRSARASELEARFAASLTVHLQTRMSVDDDADG